MIKLEDHGNVDTELINIIKIINKHFNFSLGEHKNGVRIYK